MKLRSLSLTVLCVLVLTGSARAQPGAAFLEGRGGVLIPIGNFSHQQDVGGAYTIAAGYEFLPFLDGVVEFTQAFNPSDDDHENFRVGDLRFTSEQTHQNFITALGPRINFLPSSFPVRPYATLMGGWYHFANFNEVRVNGSTKQSGNDQDAFGFEAGLGLTGTIFTLYERENDEIPLLEITLGVLGSYHYAFVAGSNREMVTTMGSVGFRF